MSTEETKTVPSTVKFAAADDETKAGVATTPPAKTIASTLERPPESPEVCTRSQVIDWIYLILELDPDTIEYLKTECGATSVTQLLSLQREDFDEAVEDNKITRAARGALLRAQEWLEAYMNLHWDLPSDWKAEFNSKTFGMIPKPPFKPLVDQK